MNQWHSWLGAALDGGSSRPDRTGTGTHSLFGLRTEWDLRNGFPAVTTKHLAFGQVKAELAAFVRGAESKEEFKRWGCNIWDGNIDGWKSPRSAGDAGRIYGVQWRHWHTAMQRPALANDVLDTWVVEVDQLKELVEGLRNDPFGRRHLVTAWNPGELDVMCLPPCHYAFQCYAESYGSEALGETDAYCHKSELRLSLMVHLRSLDLFLGMPFDVASYALLTHLIAKELGWGVGRLVMTAGDAHVYNNHVDQAREVLSREPLPPCALRLSDSAGLFDFEPAMAWLEGYHSLGAVQAPLNI